MKYWEQKQQMVAAKKWADEFRNELIDDHKALQEAQSWRKKSKTWSFDVARERTQTFYRERLTGFARCGSITASELEDLLTLVDQLGLEDFNAENRF